MSIKLPGIGLKITDYVYSLSKSSLDGDGSVMLTIRYTSISNYGIKYNRHVILEFFPDQRCGSCELLMQVLHLAMYYATLGHTEFTHEPERRLYISSIVKRIRVNYLCNQFTGHYYKY